MNAAFLISCILISWAARYFEPYIFDNKSIVSGDLFTNLDYFACGGILGYFIVTKNNSLISFIQSIRLEIKWVIVSAVILFVIFQKFILPNAETGSMLLIFKPTIIAVIFTVLIAIFLPEHSSLSIKSKILSFLGVRSYGLYIYHIIIIHLSLQYCIKNGILIDNWLTLSVFILFTLGSSIIVSSISYKYFETPFLNFRNILKN